MLESFLTKLLGANYRTTVSGFITTLSIIAAGIALNPSGVASIPEPYKGYLLSVAGVIYCISSLYKNANTADAKLLEKVATGEEVGQKLP